MSPASCNTLIWTAVRKNVTSFHKNWDGLRSVRMTSTSVRYWDGLRSVRMLPASCKILRWTTIRMSPAYENTENVILGIIITPWNIKTTTWFCKICNDGIEKAIADDVRYDRLRKQYIVQSNRCYPGLLQGSYTDSVHQQLRRLKSQSLQIGSWADSPEHLSTQKVLSNSLAVENDAGYHEILHYSSNRT